MKATGRCYGRIAFAMLVTVLALLPAGNVSGDESTETKPAGSSSASPSGDATNGEPQDAATDASRQVILYYMHGARRCKTCRSIEAYAKGVVNTRFDEEVESGALVWKVVDYDKPENRHFVDDFGLFTSSLVVVETEQGEMTEFEVLHEAWSLVRDKTRFQQYVYRALREHLG